MKTLATALLLLLQFSPATSLKILSYNPLYYYSHANYLGKIADTLHEAGHEVVMLSPVVVTTFPNKTSQHARTIYIDATPVVKELVGRKGYQARGWQDSNDPLALVNPLLNEARAYAMQCQETLSTPGLIDSLKAEHFDAAYSESIDLCGFALFHLLGITKTAVTMSHVALDGKFDVSGCPSAPSYVPGLISRFSDDMTFLERLENSVIYLVTRVFAANFLSKHDELIMALYPEMPSGTDLVANASYFFFNSEPLFDFPRPTVHKFISIGGITVDKRSVRPLPESLSSLLSERPKTVLISFGSVTKSSAMPREYKEAIREAAASLPNVTFLWKYEEEAEWITEGAPNIRLARWLPQTDLLMSGKISVFVTHSGAGSATEALLSGVPMVAIPTVGDQLRNARMIERTGTGVVLAKDQLADARTLKDALNEVLYNDKYSTRARFVAAMVEEQPQSPRERLLSHFEFMAKFGPLHQLKHRSIDMSFFTYYLLDVMLFVATVILAILAVVFVILRRILGCTDSSKRKVE